MRRIFNILFRKEWRTPLHKIEALVSAMSPAELAVWVIAAGLFSVSAFGLAGKVRDVLSFEKPARGGVLIEGIVGTPRFANPLLSVSDADRDISALIYSGLMKSTPDGRLVPDLAESYSISDDGLSYTFILRKNLKWSDGVSLTTDDIEFTILRAEDVTLKSPRRASWDGVTVEKQGPYQITFHLKQPYAFFIDNTTIGILPKHIWSGLSSDEFPFSEWNIHPVGTGPFKVSKVVRTSSGVPSQYDLVRNDSYPLGSPYLDGITLKFYQNDTLIENALANGEIESAADISTTLGKSLMEQGKTVELEPLTRTFGIFFNQNQAPLFTDKSVRLALANSVDRNSIIRNVLDNFGTPITSPVPGIENVSNNANLLSLASSTLAKAGYTMGTDGILLKKTKKDSVKLSFSLAAPNIPELVETARIVADTWKSLGINVEVKIFEPADLQQNIIRPRKYDALLFGMVGAKEPDLYAFWHSSQRNDPGLNVAMYTNPKADKILEGLRKTSNPDERKSAYSAFATEITNDVPAVFLYSPQFIYLVPNDIQGINLGPITVPSDRFSNVYEWYRKTSKVWNIFDRNK